MPKRMQSPSSILVYKQCPRRYYYQYVMKLPTSPSIHTVRGNIVHSVLEHFFETDLQGVEKEDIPKTLARKCQDLLLHFWNEYGEKLNSLGLADDKLMFYFEESLLMLANWSEKFSKKLSTFDDHVEGFRKLTPARELEYRSEELQVRGFIDAIEDSNGKLRLMDYKTSKNPYITEGYRLQLAIYSVLYQEQHGKAPDEVGIYFLKDTNRFEQTLRVDDELMNHARLEIELIHLNTEANEIVSYPKKPGPLCKFSSGQCDFYDRCFKQKELGGC